MIKRPTGVSSEDREQEAGSLTGQVMRTVLEVIKLRGVFSLPRTLEGAFDALVEVHLRGSLEGASQSRLAKTREHVKSLQDWMASVLKKEDLMSSSQDAESLFNTAKTVVEAVVEKQKTHASPSLDAGDEKSVALAQAYQFLSHLVAVGEIKNTYKGDLIYIQKRVSLLQDWLASAPTQEMTTEADRVASLVKPFLDELRSLPGGISDRKDLQESFQTLELVAASGEIKATAEEIQKVKDAMIRLEHWQMIRAGLPSPSFPSIFQMMAFTRSPAVKSKEAKMDEIQQEAYELLGTVIPFVAQIKEFRKTYNFPDYDLYKYAYRRLLCISEFRGLELSRVSFAQVHGDMTVLSYWQGTVLAELSQKEGNSVVKEANQADKTVLSKLGKRASFKKIAEVLVEKVIAISNEMSSILTNHPLPKDSPEMVAYIRLRRISLREEIENANVAVLDSVRSDIELLRKWHADKLGVSVDSYEPLSVKPKK